MKRVLQLIIVLVFCVGCLCSGSYVYAGSCNTKYYNNSTSQNRFSATRTNNLENKKYNIDNSDNVVIYDNQYYITDYSNDKSDDENTALEQSLDFGFDFKFRVQDFLVFDMLIKTKKKKKKFEHIER